MKKKLALILLSATAVLMLAGCGKQVVLPNDFDANGYSSQVAQITAEVTAIDPQNLQILAHEQEGPLKSLCEGELTAIDEAGNPMQDGAVGIAYDVNGDDVIITETYRHEFREVEYEYTFTPNEEATYNPDAPAYSLMQCVVSSKYSLGELMKQAGMNTLMGMGVVFCALIFISLIIKVMEYMPFSGAAQQRRAKKHNEAAKKKIEEAIKINDVTDQKPAASSADPMDDKQLVAVITAAVMAAYQSETGIASTDPLIVRSIKRVSR